MDSGAERALVDSALCVMLGTGLDEPFAGEEVELACFSMAERTLAASLPETVSRTMLLRVRTR